MHFHTARPLFNMTRGDRFFGFEDGRGRDGTPSELRPSRHFVQVAGDETQAAEEAFEWFNRDDRPNGRNERSVSVGDVIVLSGHDRLRRFMAVEGVGFRQVQRLDVIKGLRRHGFTLADAIRVTDLNWTPNASEMPVEVDA